MNVFIVAVCVNLLSIGNAENDIDFGTILKMMKPQYRKSGYSKIDDSNELIEAIPIIPGFYLQKPKDLSKSLFENPKDWPDDLFGVLSSEDIKTRHNKTRISAKAVNKSPRADNLKGKIMQAVKNLNKKRNSKKFKAILKKRKASVGKKEPVKKLLGRVFQGIKNGIDYRGRGKYKKPRNRETSSNTKQKIQKLLKNIIYGNTNKKYRGHQNNYEYDETIEQSKKTGLLLGSIVNAIKNSKQGRGSKNIHQLPSMVIISSGSLHDNDYELENNAKESMEVSEEDYNGANSLTRRSGKADIGSDKSTSPESSASSASSDYERNPGNPFTVHKNKYKQNWPYNHFMDGDHMNINPFGPQFGTLGPTGPELFFGRKWWYFNQDDYKPMG